MNCMNDYNICWDYSNICNATFKCLNQKIDVCSTYPQMNFETVVGFVVRIFVEKMADGSKYTTNTLHIGDPKFDHKMNLFKFLRPAWEFSKKKHRVRHKKRFENWLG